MSDNKSFYDKYSLVQHEIIQTIDSIEEREDQPNFIKMMSINGQTVAFLGDTNIKEEQEKFLNKFIRVDRMVIPEFARMINPDILQQQISTGGEDSMIITAAKGFFYDGQLDDNVILNVGGLVYREAYANISIHPCDNHKPETAAKIGLGNCPHGILAPYFNEETLELNYKLVVFYISSEDMEASNARSFEHGVHNISDIIPIQMKIDLYFRNAEWALGDNSTLDINWKEWSGWDGIEGVFLIPMRLSDESIHYYCVLNKNAPSDSQKPVKEILQNFLSSVDSYNGTSDHELLFKGNDFAFAYLDRWCISIGKNVGISHIPTDELYKESVLENKISVG